MCRIIVFSIEKARLLDKFFDLTSVRSGHQFKITAFSIEKAMILNTKPRWTPQGGERGGSQPAREANQAALLDDQKSLRFQLKNAIVLNT